MRTRDSVSPVWFRAKWMKHIVDEEEIGLQDLLTLPNFFDSTALSTKSELLLEEDKHDLVNPQAMPMSMDESIL